MSERIGISVTFFVDSEEDIVRVLEAMQRPIAGFVLEGKNVHIGTIPPDEDV